jgi:YgiT-type zinc finger domain-containing protein
MKLANPITRVPLQPKSCQDNGRYWSFYFISSELARTRIAEFIAMGSQNEVKEQSVLCDALRYNNSRNIPQLPVFANSSVRYDMWSPSTRVKNLKMPISPSLILKASSSPAKSPSVSATGTRKLNQWRGKKSSASSQASHSTMTQPKRSSKSAPPASSSSLPYIVSSELCANCGQSGVHLREVTRSFKVDGTLMLIERIPQVSCPHCGESYFTAQTMHEIERIKRLRKSLAVKTTVPIATFLAAA